MIFLIKLDAKLSIFNFAKIRGYEIVADLNYPIYDKYEWLYVTL